MKEFIDLHISLPIFLKIHETNSGFDHSILEAAEELKGNYFWCVAGDNLLSKETCSQLLSRVGKADLIIPKVISYIGRTNIRNIISWLYAFLVRIWFAPFLVIKFSILTALLSTKGCNL